MVSAYGEIPFGPVKEDTPVMWRPTADGADGVLSAISPSQRQMLSDSI